MPTEEKQIHYHGDSYDNLVDLPEKVRERFALSLFYILNNAEPALRAKAMKGLGHGVLELVKNGKPAYRCAYVVRNDGIHVLHVFTKTSNGTDKKHEDTIKNRYKSLR